MNEKKNQIIKEDFDLAFQNHKKNNFKIAENLYKKILKTDPNHFESIFLLGSLSAQTKNFNEAKQLLEKAIQINPDYADAHNNFGNVLIELGDYQKAMGCFQKTIEIQPNFTQAHSNLGIVLKELGDYQKAISCFQKAIEIQPNFAQAHNNLGTAFKELEEYQKAMSCYQEAIKIEPNNADAHYNLGIVFKELGEYQKAIICNEKAINLKPDYVRAYSNMMLTSLLLEKVDPKDYLAKTKKFRLSLKPINSDLLLKYKFDNRPEKLKIGFVSGDFQQHPVGFFLLDTLKNLKDKNLELIAYSNSQKKDNLSVKLKSHFTNWREITNQSDKKVVNQIREDGIHILFDLSGYSAKNRLPIFINKPAPIQISWAGFLASTGIPEVDYIIGDPYVTPKDNANHFAEKIFCLPNIWCCFSVPEFEVKINEPPAIKNRYITFGCFNNLSKINNEVIALWSKILKAIPKSKIFLKTKQLNDPYVKEKIMNYFKKNNINSNLLILEGSSPRNVLLDTYNKVDIALDPFPYSGGTTSFESTWMSTPVLTKKGTTFVSRTTGSINHNCGMSDWIASDENEYVKKAIKFSANFEQLSKINKSLRKTALESPLFNSLLFAKQLDTALWEMWNNFILKKGI